MSMRWLVWTMVAFWVAPGLLRAEEPPAPAESAQSVASLVCVQPVFDFGEAPSGATVTNVFLLRNDGTNAVTIVNVRPTCGCTTAGVATHRLAPGATTELNAVLSLAGRKGYQRKAIYVETDDLRQPRLRLEVKGLAVADVTVQPEGVHFGTMGREGTAQQDVLVSARSNVTFTIKSVNTGSSSFTAEVEPLVPGTSYWVHVKTVGPRMPGTVSAIVQLITDLPTSPSVAIPASVFVAADVIAVPSQLILVASSTNEPRTANLTVYSPAGKTFTVKSVDWPSPSVTGHVAATVSGRVRIEVRSRGGLEDVEGKAIRVVTDLDTAREVLVPLRVIKKAEGN